MRLARGIVALFGAVVVLEVMAALIGPVVDRSPLAGPTWIDGRSGWAKAARDTPLRPEDHARRELTIKVTGTQLQAEYELQIPVSHPVFRAVEEGDDQDQLVSDVLGDIAVAEFPEVFGERTTRTLGFGAARATRIGAGMGSISVESDLYNIVLPEIDVTVKDTGISNFVGTDVITISGTRDHRIHVHGSGDWTEYGFDTIRVDRQRAGGTVSATWRDVVDDGFVTRLRQIGGADVRAGAGLWRLFSILPGVVLVIWLRRQRDGGGPLFERPYRIALVATAITAGGAVLNALLQFEIVVGPFGQDWLVGWSGSPRPRDAGEAEGIAIVGALALPVAVCSALREKSPRDTVGWKRWSPLAGVAVTALAGTVAILVLNYPPDPGDLAAAVLPAWIWLMCAGALLGLVQFVVRWAPTRRVWQWSAVITAGLIVPLAAQRHLDTVGMPTTGQHGLALVPTTSYDTSFVNVSRIAIFTAAVIITIATYAWFVGWAAMLLANEAGATRRRWYAAGAAAATLVCFTPRIIELLTDRPWSDVGVHSLSDTIDLVTSLNIFVLYGCLAAGLRLAAAQGWPSLNAAIPLSAVAATGVSFYFDDRWAYLPVTIMLGLIVTAALVRRVDDELPDPLARALIDRAVMIELERSALLRRRATLIADIDTAEASALDGLKKSRRAVDAQLSALPDIVDDAPERSPLRSRWRHGLYAALAGTVFGLPWTIVFLSDARSYPIDSGPFGGATFAVWVVRIVAQWTAYGFFFGYFHPWLRGRNGLTKALSLTMLVVAPPLVLNFVWHSDADWINDGIFVLKVFAFASTLSLVTGDRLILKRFGMGARQLVDIYNVRFALVWGSAFVLAVGGILTAVATVGLQGLATMLIERLGSPPPSPR